MKGGWPLRLFQEAHASLGSRLCTRRCFLALIGQLASARLAIPLGAWSNHFPVVGLDRIRSGAGTATCAAQPFVRTALPIFRNRRAARLGCRGGSALRPPGNRCRRDRKCLGNRSFALAGVDLSGLVTPRAERDHTADRSLTRTGGRGHRGFARRSRFRRRGWPSSP